jgi:23S rRNA pseudouridine1911/1915/1917 synthase
MLPLLPPIIVSHIKKLLVVVVVAARNHNHYSTISKTNIVYLDNHLIAVDKPNLMLCQSNNTITNVVGKNNNTVTFDNRFVLPNLVKNYLQHEFSKPGNVYLGNIHRIDYAASGIVLFGRTEKATSRMAEQFRLGLIEKTYLVIVHDPTHFFSLDLNDGNDNKNNYKSGIFQPQNTDRNKQQFSDLYYRFISRAKINQDWAILRVAIQSGKKHQIRQMLSDEGFPVVGDVKYGSSISYCPGLPSGSILLHALSLRFNHPVRKQQQPQGENIDQGGKDNNIITEKEKIYIETSYPPNGWGKYYSV